MRGLTLIILRKENLKIVDKEYQVIFKKLILFSTISLIE